MNMCQICVRGLYKYGARQYNTNGISVHHIVPLKDNYELRDENSNLISLCECHHKMADSGEIPKKVLQKIALEQEQTPPAIRIFSAGGFVQETRGISTQKIPKMKF